MTQQQAAWTSVGEYLQRRESYDKEQQLEWERGRWMAYNIISPFLGKRKPTTPKQWVKFPWESSEPARVIPVTKSDELTLNDIFKDFIGRKNNIG